MNAADALIATAPRSLRLYHPRRAVGRGRRPHHRSKLKELVITDSIQPTDAVNKAANIRMLSIAPLIAEAISRTASEDWFPAFSTEPTS